ncbi:MOSC domain-containing protein [Sarocladium implicatum]|nr:MOSC domain-containing protein [Sarocladium implicatum]
MPSPMDSLLNLDPVPLLLVAVTVVVFVVPIFILFPPVPVDTDDVLGQTHSKLGLDPTTSNLPKRISGSAALKERAPKVQSLWIYPIKSCKGIEVVRSNVLPTGLEHDRLFTFAMLGGTTPANGQQPDNVWKFQTQRQLPLLANVTTDIWLPDINKESRALGRPKEGFLVVKFPWTDAGWRSVSQRFVAKLSRGWSAVPKKEFILPLEFPSSEEQKQQGYEFGEVKVWKETVSALNMSKEIPPELSQYLGAKGKLGLFRMDPEVRQREVFRCAMTKDALGYQPIVDFQDAYPLHLLNLSSVVDLESKVQKDKDLDYLDPRRFRANIIISGTEAYNEDEWRRIKCAPSNEEDGDVCEFDVSCRTVRCKMPNVNPEDGKRHRAEPDYALRKYRDVDEGAPKNGCLGVQMVPIYPDAKNAKELSFIISVGMSITVEGKGEHVYIPQ